MKTTRNVVLLKGTSGSGKTYIAEAVLRKLRDSQGDQEHTFAIGPKGKLGGYLFTEQDVAVIGRYESACGGCDAMSWKGAADDIEAKIAELVADGYDVFLEGLIVGTWGVDRYLRVGQLLNTSLTVIHLETSLEDCITSVRNRRVAAGNTAEFNTENTAAKHKSLQSTTRMQLERGVNVERLDRAAALARALELLEL
jgi:hypothetical protein